ncbi:hypothetical protein COV93_00795 [Candidatus Woesearchaeota archaeon CG11_big_fil_rev_8_21_14_0_20_43_8]|nr:MAG: hypothetical protein COV93_00795 [Candidatus Woesearchaeota archaeon CG11_big_fil_rev_8_21_14_0_20_43_8]
MIEPDGLELRMDAEEKHHGILAGMLNTAWGSFVTATPDIMKIRLSSGAEFFFVYDNATNDDADFIQQNYGGVVCVDERIPVAILETIGLKTDFVYDNVPKSYDLLTDNGLWKAPEMDADTIILVDITALPTRLAKHVKGLGGTPKDEARKLVGYAHSHIEKNTSYDAIWTFTPNIDAVKRWHESNGASDTKYLISSARPGFKVQSVNMMSYPVNHISE